VFQVIGSDICLGYRTADGCVSMLRTEPSAHHVCPALLSGQVSGACILYITFRVLTMVRLFFIFLARHATAQDILCRCCFFMEIRYILKWAFRIAWAFLDHKDPRSSFAVFLFSSFKEEMEVETNGWKG
jgi:hypothetical protein